jgi:hypothetical protein
MKQTLSIRGHAPQVSAGPGISASVSAVINSVFVFVVKQSAYRPPAAGDVKSRLGVARVQPLLKNVEEETGPQAAVRAIAQGADRAHQRRAGACLLGENALADLDVGRGETLSDRSYRRHQTDAR